MGTWDIGLLDNDTALDGLGDLGDTLRAQTMALLRQNPTKARAERVAGGVGLLLQLQPGPYSWTESDDGNAFRASLGAWIAKSDVDAFLAPGARAALAAVVDGSFDFEAPAKLASSTSKLLHASGSSAFGVHHAALFATDGASAVVGDCGRTITAMINEDFEDKDNWSDLCREGVAMGALGFLLAMTPMTVSSTTLQRWREKARTGLAALEENADEELEFHRGYYKNLDAAFAQLLTRAA